MKEKLVNNVLYNWQYSLFFLFSNRLFGHSFFIPATTANDLWHRRFSIPNVVHYIYVPILILEKESVFPFKMLSAINKGTTGTIFSLCYDAILDWGLNPGPHTLEASTKPLGYRGGGDNIVELKWKESKEITFFIIDNLACTAQTVILPLHSINWPHLAVDVSGKNPCTLTTLIAVDVSGKNPYTLTMLSCRCKW